MKRLRIITKTACFLLSLLCGLTAQSYAQASTASSKNATSPDDTIHERARDYADDNVRLAASEKALREAKLLRDEILEKIERSNYLDSVNKSLERLIDIKEARLQANDAHVFKQNNTIWELENRNSALERKIKLIEENNDKWTRRGKKRISVGLGGSGGYDIISGNRAAVIGFSAHYILFRL